MCSFFIEGRLGFHSPLLMIMLSMRMRMMVVMMRMVMVMTCFHNLTFPK